MDNEISNQLGLQLTTNEFDQLVKRLCFFAPAGSGDYVRDLHDFIVLQTLSIMHSGVHSVREIYEKVLSTLGNRFEYEEVFEALRRLVSRGEVRSRTQRFEDSENRFEIQIDIRTRLREQVHHEEELESRVLTKWKSNLKSKYPNINQDIIEQMTKDVKICAYRLLSSYAVEALEVYYANNDLLNEMIRSAERLNFLDPSPVIPPDFELLRTQEVFDFFLLADEERKMYIASLIHSVFLLYITQLDKSCSALLRKELRGGTIYLDTNFVFGLVGLSGPDLLLSTQQLIKMTLDLGFKVVISPRTLSEYEHALGTVLRDIKIPLASSELARLALESARNHDIYSIYWEEVAKPSGVHVDPQLFFDYYEKLPAILETYGVTVEDTYHNEIMAMEKEMAEEVSRLRSAMETAFGPEAVDGTSEHVLEHDAYHRLLVLRHRVGTDKQRFCDARAWFLTFDSKLPFYDRISRRNDPDILPFCVLSGQWLQLIRPYSSGNGDLELAQVNLVVSPLLRAYPKPPNSLINSVITTISHSTKFVPKAVAQMLSDRHFLEQFRTAENEDVRQDLIDSYYAAYADEAEKKLIITEKQMEEVKTELNKVLQEKKDLENIIARETATRKQIENENNSKSGYAENLERNLDMVRKETEQIVQGLRIENEQSKKEYDQRIEQLLIERDQERLERNRDRLILKLLIPTVFLVGYLIVREPFSSSPVPYMELVTAIVSWLVFILMMFHRTRWITVIAAVAITTFVISLSVPTNISTAIQTGSSVFGVFAFALQAYDMWHRKLKYVEIIASVTNNSNYKN